MYVEAEEKDNSEVPWWIPLIALAVFAILVIFPFYLSSDSAQRLTPEALAEDKAKCESMRGEWLVIRKSSGKDMGKVGLAWCHFPLEATDFSKAESE